VFALEPGGESPSRSGAGPFALVGPRDLRPEDIEQMLRQAGNRGRTCRWAGWPITRAAAVAAFRQPGDETARTGRAFATPGRTSATFSR